MKKGTIFNIALTVIGLALSLFLAIGSGSLYDNFRIPTPGILAARILISRSPNDWMGNQLGAQIFVDWIFWYAVMLSIYFLTSMLGRRLKGRKQ
ncbi:MAG: hypothetical protein ABSA78_22215 [Candidatus Sulfotelmatobacter sp.]|jgi:hypothetical protein